MKKVIIGGILSLGVLVGFASYNASQVFQEFSKHSIKISEVVNYMAIHESKIQEKIN